MEKKIYLCRFNESEIFLEVAKDSEWNFAYFKLYKMDQNSNNLSVFYRNFVSIDRDDEVLEILEFCEKELMQKIYYDMQISQEGFEYLKNDK